MRRYESGAESWRYVSFGMRLRLDPARMLSPGGPRCGSRRACHRTITETNRISMEQRDTLGRLICYEVSCDKYVRLSFVFVSLSVCPLAYLENYAAELLQILYACSLWAGRGLVLFWRRCDTLCTVVSADDIMFSYNGLYIRRVMLRRDVNNSRKLFPRFQPNSAQR